MAFDTFDEGIAPGGLRSKNEIKILICYLYRSVNDRMSKELITEAIGEYDFANFFEISAAFDELVKNGSIIEAKASENETEYIITENGRIIAEQLESTLSPSVKDKTYACAIKLLDQRKNARQNSVEIVKTADGAEVICVVRDGSLKLFSFTMFAPDIEQAELIKKNFMENPANVYKTMLALLTKDKAAAYEIIEETFESFHNIF